MAIIACLLMALICGAAYTGDKKAMWNIVIGILVIWGVLSFVFSL